LDLAIHNASIRGLALLQATLGAFDQSLSDRTPERAHNITTLLGGRLAGANGQPNKNIPGGPKVLDDGVVYPSAPQNRTDRNGANRLSVFDFYQGSTGEIDSEV
jgi:hypothetical protein